MCFWINYLVFQCFIYIDYKKKDCHNYYVVTLFGSDQIITMVSCNYQFDSVWNHLGVSVRGCLD